MDASTQLKRRRSDYVDTFSSPQGARVFDDLTEFCGAYKSSFTGEPHYTEFNEGMRRVWLRIRGFMEMTDEEIIRRTQGKEVAE